MTKEEMKQYEDKKPIAVYPMNNFGGVEILDVLHGDNDYVIYRYNFSMPEETIHKTKVYYGPKRAYIRIGDATVNIDSCVRI